MAGGDEILSTVELADALGVSVQRVAAWIKRGLPVESRNGHVSFDAGKVEQWLLQHGLIAERQDEPAGRVCRTRAEAAKALGVHQQTISDWANGYAGFPGRAGTPGKRDGYYPIDEINQWRQSLQGPNRIGGGSGTVDVERARLLAIQCEEKELKLQERRGELEHKEVIAKFMRRVIAPTAAILEEVPDRVLAGLPGNVGDEARRAIRQIVANVIRDARLRIGELATGDADELATD